MSKANKEKQQKQLPPAKTPEAWENRLIAMAYEQAEEQLLSGKASSQIINHFLKLGSTKEKLEKEILEQKHKLMEAQTEGIKDSKRMEKLYTDAIEAMKAYQGNSDDSDI